MSLILLPALVLMLITMLVWSNLFVRRIIAVKAAGLNIQDYPTPEKFNEVLSDRVQAPANCFRNNAVSRHLCNLFLYFLMFIYLEAFWIILGVGQGLGLGLSFSQGKNCKKM